MINYRIMKSEDIPQVTTIEREIFSMPWSEKAFEESLDSPNTIYIVAEKEGTIYGYCGMYISFEIGDISNVAVGKDYRKRGIAGRMLEELLQQAKAKGVTDVTLEVRETNIPAIRLYEKMGFVEEGIRKNFYERPTENALIMWKHKI